AFPGSFGFDRGSMVSAGLSVMATSFNVTLPELVMVPENVIGCPGPEAFTHDLVTLIAGLVVTRQLALAWLVTGSPEMLSAPVTVTVSFWAPLVGGGV